MTPTPAVSAKKARERIEAIADILKQRDEALFTGDAYEADDDEREDTAEVILAALSTEGEAEPVAWLQEMYGEMRMSDARWREQGAFPVYASAPAGVKVKPLEWQACQNDIHHANPDWLFCGYVIARTGERVTWRPSESDEWRESASLDEAKAAAQADYEQRIRSSLQPDTQAAASAPAQEGRS